jgi:hypothetical protein
MLLIYAHITSARLQYIVQFIVTSLHGNHCRITIDPEEFRHYDGPKINYSESPLATHELWIKNAPLLFEYDIRQQVITCFEHNGHTAFFKNDTGYPFDIFAAAFYLLSRYEEYLPHTKDSYGRYAHDNSLAFKEGFLQLPLINIWALQLAQALKEKFPAYDTKEDGFRFVPTYDIDIAYSYRHKGLWRNIGGALRSPNTIVDRIAVLAGAKKDHFDCYDWLHQLHSKYQLDPIFFFLVAQKTGEYDKNILPHKDAMWRLVKKHAAKYTVGLHPSWQSGDKKHLLSAERIQLEAMAEKKIILTRQHYIRFTLPHDYTSLADKGFTGDYSMGYGSINGFRASVATPFYWYDLPADEQSSLLLHPFCYMDANSYYEQQMTPAEAMKEMQHYLAVCKKVNGTLCTIWHNNFLGTDPAFKGWRELYEEFVGMV